MRLVRGDREAFGLPAAAPSSGSRSTCCSTRKSASSRSADAPGTGKSALALCAGLEAVMERKQHRKLVVFRPLYAVGGQELGYLPGSEADKMNPWAQAVFDTLSARHVQGCDQRSGGQGHAGDPAADPYPRPVAA